MEALVLASRNRKKAAELLDLLSRLDIELLTAADIPGAPEVVEDGTTFADNAALKASTLARVSGHWAIGDDSGLAVDALNGSPGVHSARYAGEHATDAENRAHLLAALEQVPDGDRGAQFICHLAVADPSGHIRARADGSCRGQILRAEKGSGGFGYDPLFLIPEYHRTFGELSPIAKSVLSHRARAVERLLRLPLCGLQLKQP